MPTDPTAGSGAVPDSAPAEGGEAPPRPPVRLLLVDDEPGLRTAVKAYREDEGFAVTTATDGEEGWTMAQQIVPDVVITDVMMPRCDGYGLLKRLRAD
ncbi:MAG: response regulator, partial [Synechococcaceae cyanobacterium]|nr:response regulator [Synechococcaceae cyanobacterium]